MAGFFRLHNKFHRSSHHSLSSASVQDQGVDPIASKDEPFNGIFYNILTDVQRTFNIPTNSYEWWSTYTTVCAFSANWDSIGTTYTTVNANSANWDLGYNAYQTLCAVSANYDSTYSTVCANSAAWGNEYILYTNRVQENTRSKTFSGYKLTVNPDNTVDWDLDIAQVAFLTLNSDVTLNNPIGGTKKSGGLYNLYVIQGYNMPIGGWKLNFQSDYLFPVGVDITTDMNFNLSGTSIFSFFSDGVFMYGDFYKTNLIEPEVTSLVTIVDGFPIKQVAGGLLYPIGNKGIIDFNNYQIYSFNDEEIDPLGYDYVEVFSSGDQLEFFGSGEPLITFP